MELRAQLNAALEGVHGWLSRPEAWRLHEAARRGPASPGGPVVVEIGSWMGRSTISMALGIRSRGSGRVYAVDPHTAASEHRALRIDDTFDQFISNLERAGVREFVTPMRMRSHDARGSFTESAIDILFVDGSHDYEDVKQDIADWVPLLADRAFVAFNDPFWPGVNRALREDVVNREFGNPRLQSNTIFLDYRRARHASLGERFGVVRLWVLLVFGRIWWRFKRRLPPGLRGTVARPLRSAAQVIVRRPDA